MAQKVLLLYSGGLDTSVMIRWIKENLGYDVVTLTLDVGQDSNDLDAIAQKAVKIGAVDTITKDVKEEFVRNYAFKDVKADGLYQGTYPLSTAVARPLMASVAVEVAHDTGCSIIAHGCTGKGNDQVRFDLAIRSLDSTLKVIAPVRDWNMNRDQEAEYARKHGIPVKNGGKYSTDENLWGRSVEGSDLEDPSMPVPEDAYLWVTPPSKVDGTFETVTLGFTSGIPVSLNGEHMDPVQLVKKLNGIAGSRGVGAIDHLEDRVTGIKSREFYECPAAVTVLTAHRALEKLVLTRKELELKHYIDNIWSNMVYEGFWFDPLMAHINAFEESVNTPVSGKVTLKLGKGMCIVSGVESQNSLYNYGLTTYSSVQTFDQTQAPGFISIYGLQSVLASSVRSVMKEAEITQ
ncbi:argininosuccinate synthase [Thermogymnomonas acidicola]|uniref:Argininosuccinate synthase n=1 Tax=Thermogymnomonas acidicola TaxID=399579 RepID=A0AA37BQP9_9ARCH|nr:argininosuccinate synthase [Thermogymnomonas acidicola]GGM71542.1 argininosuccinate synthase [Thermogymnomonas acidicola]